MALPNLAEVADLQDRDATVEPSDLVEAMLAVASATVRDAAQSPILQNDSVVVLTGWGEQLLDLPGQPIQTVTSVEVDGVAVTDFKLANGRLWRRSGWGCSSEPSEVEVTMTHGMPEVPAEIVNLVCDLATAGIAAAESSETFDPRVSMERIDDYSVSFKEGAEAVSSIMDLTPAARARLRTRFGGGAQVVEYR